MSRRAKRPLNREAVKVADDAFYEAHPELAKDGKRQALSPNDPEQASLRKEWMDAYIASGGGYRETGVARRQVGGPREPCSLDFPWVELEYLYADEQGVPGAEFVIKSAEGAILRAGTLDDKGFCHVDRLPPECSQITYYFDNDPPPYKIFEEYKPIPNPFPKPPPDYIEQAADALRRLGEWGWGVVEGDFNQDPSMSQIGVRTVITLIPVVDQAGDIQDLGANLKFLIWDEKYDELWVWFALVVTLIGCIPEVGSVVKGVLKAIGRRGKHLPVLADLLRKLNGMGKGNAVRWLKELSQKLDGYANDVIKRFNDILHKLTEALKRVRRFVSNEVGGRIDDILRRIKEVRKRASAKIKEVVSDLKKRLDEILGKGKRVEPTGSTKTKNTLRQEAEVVHRRAVKRTGQKAGKPAGKRTKIRGEANTRRKLELENKSADELANTGYKVDQNPPPKPNGRKPDYKIEGEYFDCYSPGKSTPARNIVDRINTKVDTGQADRIVLNLTDSDVRFDDLRKALSDYPDVDLKEIIVVKGDEVIPFFP